MRWTRGRQFAMPAATLLGGALLMAGAALRPQLKAELALQAVSPASSVLSAQTPKHSPQEFFVMIDPSHGGDDNGAMLGGGKVTEKEVSLALARELKRQLGERGIAARLLRDSDMNLSLERRAAMTNEERAGIYIALHASQPGKGVRVYAPAVIQQAAAGRFLPWEGAQAGSLERSRAVARMVANELRKTGLPVASLAAPVRPLNNLITPAIAVEWTPGAEELRPPQLQKLGSVLASAMASGILQARLQGADRP
jgi:N-acetylmuramoyl-L-alanine amidase